MPLDKLDWKPHPKSGTLGWLASHVATVTRFATTAITTDSWNISDPDPNRGEVITGSREQLLGAFDRVTATARQAIAGAADEHLKKPWKLLYGEQTIFTLPRYEVVRNFTLNHLIHHRAQLTVYLRMNDVPLPALYGPSADEQM